LHKIKSIVIISLTVLINYSYNTKFSVIKST